MIAASPPHPTTSSSTTTKPLQHPSQSFQDAVLQVSASLTPSSALVGLLLILQSLNSFFKTLVDHEVTVELKNDIQIKGTLKSVDQYLNIKLDDIQVVEELKYPHLSSVKNVFIRGSVVRYVHLPGGAVDTALLEDATRREAAQQAQKTK
ncbi:U6 snRNA-associated Sm-like protein LSm2 [Lachnellula cervina]|uniref:U6 snRNA-associated Sm-like protein LSm2 n=1 Tax=Lachnellula cervina TaxID=1316786 RepID=A0A7D8USG0_9HELO|nr:U6 snRNA-associated Sm-like protein LSm2 [Lachnellula cervina]